MRLKFKIELPNDILEINKVFKQNGFELFVVGGAVRDSLLFIEPKDFDLATNAEPDIVEKIMKDAGFRTLETGKAFGVINVFTETNEFEIATFRKDIGIGRRPDAVEFTTIEGDVLRRDLTCNALFYDIETEEIVDLVGGIEDIQNHIVRTVGPAKDRFNEDRLRILRVIRFTARFDSKLDDDIIHALIDDSSLEGISGERIHDEFIKGVKSAKNTKNYLGLLYNFNLLEWIFPDMVLNIIFPNSKDYIIVVTKLLFHYNDMTTMGKKLNELRFSTDDVKTILFLINLQTIDENNVVDFKRQEKRTKATKEQIIEIGRFIGLEDSFINKFNRFELSIDGEFVMEEFGLKAGPELGEKIKLLEIQNFLKL
jgi:tRNA nucleotidyltransferase/poly(A) polymerase